MQRLIITAVIVAVVAAVAIVIRRRRSADAPTQRHYSVPEQLDRGDFSGPERPWLVAVFTSATCEMCQGVLERALVLESGHVAVAEIEFTANRQLHSKYDIDAVPTLVLCDAEGVVRASFLGPVNATDLWAAVAEARDPGSSPEPHLGQVPHSDSDGPPP